MPLIEDTHEYKAALKKFQPTPDMDSWITLDVYIEVIDERFNIGLITDHLSGKTKAGLESQILKNLGLKKCKKSEAAFLCFIGVKHSSGAWSKAQWLWLKER